MLVQAGMLVLLKVLGLDIRPLLAAGGLGGIVLGLATQSLLANALAGLHLVSPLHTAGLRSDATSVSRRREGWELSQSHQHTDT